VNEADRHLLEGADGGLVGLGSPVEAVANQTAMDGTARKLAVDATAHHLGYVIERQLQAGTQFADERFFQGCPGGAGDFIWA
jgi:hypothetical protein